TEPLRIEEQRLVELVEQTIEGLTPERRTVATLELGADLVARGLAVAQLQDRHHRRRQARHLLGQTRRIAKGEKLLSVFIDREGLERPEARTVHLLNHSRRPAESVSSACAWPRRAGGPGLRAPVGKSERGSGAGRAGGQARAAPGWGRGSRRGARARPRGSRPRLGGG